MDIPPEKLDVKLLAEILDPYRTLTDISDPDGEHIRRSWTKWNSSTCSQGEPEQKGFWRSTDGVTTALVRHCLENQILKSDYYLGADRFKEQAEEWTLLDHAARIAWMVANNWTDPIELDFGIPSLGHSWYPLLDGHHRLAAAIYREDPWILANCSGSVDEIERFKWDGP